MTYAYTTASQIKAEIRATMDFSSSTYPTADQVATWIAEESDRINAISGRTWGSTVYTETLDYQGEDALTLVNAPIISVESVIKSPYSLGTDLYSLSETMVVNDDYTVYANDGEIVFLNDKPIVGRKSVQVNYTAGFATTPPRVQKIATKRVALRVIDSLLEKDVNEKASGKSVSVGSISIVKPADVGVSQYREIKTTLEEEEGKLLSGAATAYRIPTHRY